MITSIAAFIIAFGLLVLVHEFGHFWVAKKSGVFVEKFSIGFGPKIFGFKWGQTDFCVSLIPLGGYVKMHGEGDEEKVTPGDKTAFSNKSVPIRSGIVLAGPAMNLILSFILIPFVFWIGKPEVSFLKEPPVIERIVPNSPAEGSNLKIGDLILRIDGKTTPVWEDVLQTLVLIPVGHPVTLEIERNKTKETAVLAVAGLPNSEGSYLGIEKFFGKAPEAVVKEVIPGSPASLAGILAGDKIVTVAGKPVADWDALVREVALQKGTSLSVTLLREKTQLQVSLTPKWDEGSKRWLMGIRGLEDLNLNRIQIKQYSFLEAVQVGFSANIKNIVLTFQVLKRLFSLELSYKALGGPVQIAYALGKASASGLADFLYFTAFLSVQLAILNILPIPMLDGGHLLFFLIEAVRRRPLTLKTRMISQQIGLVLLLTLILFVTFNDLERLLGLSQWLQKIFN